MTAFLPLNLFAHFKNVLRIHVFQTYTKMAPPKNGHFLQANSLEEIILVNQKFDELGTRVFEGAKNLKLLKLDNNEIMILDEDTFANLGTLQTLTLTKNEIKELPEQVFASLITLKLLDLSSNLISEIPLGIFDSNRDLKDIRLDRNQLLFVAHIYMAEMTSYDFTDTFCIDGIFEKTSKLNKMVMDHCIVNGSSVRDVVMKYQEQEAINQICEHKDYLNEVKTQLQEVEMKRLELIMELEDSEHEITKIKLYKNSLC